MAQVPEIRDPVTLTNRADENTGNSIREKGLVLPDGYKLCDNQPSGSFVCPVRSWTMCKSFKGLASHFKVCNKHSLISILLGISVDLVAAQLAHRGDMFNDNGDGTLSAVQRRSGQEHPIVVSQNSLDPTESPMVLFGVSGHPPGPFDHRVGEQQTGKMATTPNAAPTVARDAMAIETSPISAKSKTENHANRDEDPSDLTAAWAYVCTQLGKTFPMPTSDGAMVLLRLPLVRSLQLDTPIETHLDDRQLISVLIFMTGME